VDVSQKEFASNAKIRYHDAALRKSLAVETIGKWTVETWGMSSFSCSFLGGALYGPTSGTHDRPFCETTQNGLVTAL
jgi:hypothetical protein